MVRDRVIAVRSAAIARVIGARLRHAQEAIDRPGRLMMVMGRVDDVQRSDKAVAKEPKNEQKMTDRECGAHVHISARAREGRDRR
jgi:hypothetical protein